MSTPVLAQKLDSEQRKRASAAADGIAAAALCTAPIDRAACRDAVDRAYASLALPPPAVHFFDSPLAAMAAMQGMAGLGREVDVSFNDELNRATDAIVRLAGWPSLSRLVDTRLGPLVHYAHACDDALEARVPPADHMRLLYWSGSACLWRFAQQYARVQALVDLGELPAAPAGLQLGRTLLAGCGWVNAFDKTCLVSERPQALDQEGRPRDPDGLRSRVTWRDGLTSEHVHRG